MAYTMKCEGMEEIVQTLRSLGDDAIFAASLGLYDGAGEMARAVNEEAQKIRTAEFKYAKGSEQRLPSPEEKQILLDEGAMGIARFDKNDDGVNTSVGYNAAGYADVKWNHMSSNARTNYKAVTFKGHSSNASSFLKAVRKAGGGDIGKGAQNQKPIGVIANAINSGTSFMKKQPFIQKGMMKGKTRAVEAMTKRIEQMLNKIIKESGGKSA